MADTSPSVLGPANAELWNEEPIMLNRHVYLLPSIKNRHLEDFLSKVSSDIVDIRDLSNDTDTLVSCVLGMVTWCTRTCIFMKDTRSECGVNLILKGNVSNKVPHDISNSYVYVYGAASKENSDFETQTEDCVISLVADDSNPHLCLIIVRRWWYRRLLPDSSLVVSLPDPQSMTVPSLVAAKSISPSNTRKRKANDVSPFLSPNRLHTEQVQTSGSKEKGTPLKVNAVPTHKGKDYQYTKLSLLSEMKSDIKINVCGRVVHCKPHFRTRGTDHCSSFAISDQSSMEMSCVIFNKNASYLPTVSIGDIILIRRVWINLFNSLPQVAGKDFSSFLIFSSDVDEALTPISTSPNATLSDHDIQIVKMLRLWTTAAERKRRGNVSKIENAQPSSYHNFVVQVVSVFPIVPQKCICLSVCDGTILPLATPKIASKGFKMESDKELLKKYKDLVVDIMIYCSPSTKIPDIHPCDIVFLDNVHVYPLHQITENQERVLCVELRIDREHNDDPVLSILKNDDPLLLQLKQTLNSLSNSSSSSENAIVMVKSFATYHLHLNQPFSTLGDILECSKVPNKFRCVARPSAILPGNICDIVRLSCPQCTFVSPTPSGSEQNGTAVLSADDVCPACQQSMLSPPKLQYTYHFSLELEDETGALCCTLCEEDSALFLNAAPPTNLHLDSTSRVKVWELLCRLFDCDPFNSTAVHHTSLTRPQMDCCIFSYYANGLPKDEEDKKNAQVNYRIFDTILLDKDQ